MKPATTSLLFYLTLMLVAPAAAQFRLEKTDTGIQVFHQDVMTTQYVTEGRCPILWPLLAPDGTKMTRDYPMSEQTPDEKRDHPHHRSLWFTHGAVNGTDFWHKGGQVVHQEYTRLDGGPQAVIESTSVWRKDDGQDVLKERRRMTFGANETMRWIDFDLVLSALDGEVHFGDTKEGTFAVRVAESMKVDRGTGGKIVNSLDQTNLAAWGQPADWVNYTGPIGEKTYGIAMFCHPSSFNYPHRWHVRTYGLFAANPFGLNSFTGNSEEGMGVRLKPSESLQFSYRVVLHQGISDKAQLDKIYQEFAQTQREKL
jgi:hypothetical protein